MSLDKDEQITVYIKLFRWCGLYQLVHPEGPRVFGYRLYGLINIVLVVFTTTFTALGFVGFVYKLEESFDTGFQNMQRLFATACIVVGNLKITTIIWNADKIYELFNIAHETFLLSKHLKKNNTHVKSSGHFWRTFPWYFVLLYTSLFLWVTTPVILNLYFVDESELIAMNVPKPNFFHLKYPVRTTIYNSYFKVYQR